MTDADDIDYATAAWYANGNEPLDVAEQRTALLLEAAEDMAERAARGLPALPSWPDTGHRAVARKILGLLLDAGWRPPSDEAVQAAVAKVHAEQDRVDAWWATLGEHDRRRAREHYERHGEFPADLRPSS